MQISLETRQIDSLRTYGRNAKKHDANDVRMIEASIRRFGFNDPIGILPDGRIVEGEGRLAAARNIGMTEVPVLVLRDFTQEQADLYRIAHNKIALTATFDFKMLAGALRELLSEDISFESMGFNADLGNNILRTFGDTQTTQASNEPQRVSYEIVWDDDDQRREWGAFVQRLRARSAPNASLASMVVAFIAQNNPEQRARARQHAHV